MEALPDTLRNAPRSERLKWYEKEVSRELPAFHFLEQLEAGTRQEVHGKLKKVRREIARVSHAIRLLSDETLTTLLRRKQQAEARCAAVVHERGGGHSASLTAWGALWQAERNFCECCRLEEGCPYKRCPYTTIGRVR